MEVGVITDLVNNMGFPVAACLILLYMNRETSKHYRELLTEFKSTIDNNTMAINRLSEKVKGD